MGDTLSPRGTGSGSGPASQPPGGGAYAPPPAALAVVAPPGPPPEDDSDRYDPDVRPSSPVWQAIKWPLRKALLGLYIAIQAVRRHKLVTLVVSALLIGLIVTALIVRQLTLSGTTALAIEKPSLPAIPASVVHYLHGQATYNAQEMWDSLDTAARTKSSSTESQIQTTLNQERSQGVHVTRYIYSGGYQAPDGSSYYTIEVYALKSGQLGSFTWYFTVGSNGLITGVTTL